MPLNVPIVLTWLRIAVIPVFVALYYLPAEWLPTATRDACAAWTFIVAALTDWFDGWLARRWNQTSSFGAFLDPVADKLMVCTALLVLLALQRVDVLIALIIIGREIAISALREWMAAIGAGRSVAVHRLGKLKTAAQMTAIPCLLYWQPIFGFSTRWAGRALIIVAAILTIWSMAYYLQRAWPAIRERGGMQ
jgi:CDP-diacylglycerol--glycerol-3-phosphate 3-phosphatidyltransferase/cardiolipin synthase